MSVGRTSERGDTLVEALVAISVLAVVIVGAFSVMNKGVASMYDSMEQSQVRFLLDQQIESLTYARDQALLKNGPTISTLTAADLAAAAAWQSVASLPSVGAVPAVEDCSGANGFYLNRTGGGYLQVQTSVAHAVASGFPGGGDGLWVQKINSSGAAVIPYKDFYVKACWQPTGSPSRQVLSTIVRLYDQ